MDKIKLIEKIKKFPETPGIYVMRNSRRQILYIGKATSLKHRVISYFQRPQEARIEAMVDQIYDIEVQRTDSVVEALLLENNLIKKYDPKYNIKLKDGKTYLGILVTKEDWPIVMPARMTKNMPEGEFFGPFPSSKDVGSALQILRKLFPFRVSCVPESGKACFEYNLGMCPGVCFGKISKAEYQESIKQIKMFLRGRKKDVILFLERQMKLESKRLEYEKAAKTRDQVFALRHIQDVAMIRDEDLDGLKPLPDRIEAYDISNISGEFTVGSMVVLTDGLIDKSQYRKFKIKSNFNQTNGSDDIASLREVLIRRLAHEDWQYPDIILVDGGRGQVNAFNEILLEKNINIPVVGIAKGLKRDRNDLIIPPGLELDKKLLIKIRDEAHRFAISYYRSLHQKNLLKP